LIVPLPVEPVPIVRLRRWDVAGLICA